MVVLKYNIKKLIFQKHLKKKIIIFDEINNTSLPVLDLLISIIVDKKALLPDGFNSIDYDEISKKKLY